MSKDPQYLYDLGKSEFTKGNLQAAKDVFNELIHIESKRGDFAFDFGYENIASHYYVPACFLLASVEGTMGNFIESRDLFKKVTQLLPNDCNAYHSLAKIEEHLGNLPEAREARETLTVLMPDSAGAFYDLGVVCFRLDDYKAAKIAFEKSIELDPHSAQAHNDLGFTEFSLANYEAARSLYLQATYLKPDFTQAYCNLGSMELDLGNYSASRTALSKAIEFSPEYWVAHFNLGVLEQQLGNFASALELYQSAIKHNPECHQAYINLSVIYLQRGIYSRARDSLEEAIRLQPTQAEAHNNLGIVHQEMGNLQAALDAHQTALQCDPRSGEAFNGIGLVRGRQGDALEARTAYLQAVRYLPNHAVVRLNLATIQYYLGNFPEANDSLEKSISLNGYDPYAWGFLISTFRNPFSSYQKDFSLKNLFARYFLSGGKNFSTYLAHYDEAPMPLGTIRVLEANPQNWSVSLYKRIATDVPTLLDVVTFLKNAPSEERKVKVLLSLAKVYASFGDPISANTLLSRIVSSDANAIEPYYLRVLNYINCCFTTKDTQIQGYIDQSVKLLLPKYQEQDSLDAESAYFFAQMLSIDNNGEAALAILKPFIDFDFQPTLFLGAYLASEIEPENIEQWLESLKRAQIGNHGGRDFLSHYICEPIENDIDYLDTLIQLAFFEQDLEPIFDWISNDPDAQEAGISVPRNTNRIRKHLSSGPLSQSFSVSAAATRVLKREAALNSIDPDIQESWLKSWGILSTAKPDEIANSVADRICNNFVLPVASDTPRGRPSYLKIIVYLFISERIDAVEVTYLLHYLLAKRLSEKRPDGWKGAASLSTSGGSGEALQSLIQEEFKDAFSSIAGAEVASVFIGGGVGMCLSTALRRYFEHRESRKDTMAFPDYTDFKRDFIDLVERSDHDDLNQAKQGLQPGSKEILARLQADISS